MIDFLFDFTLCLKSEHLFSKMSDVTLPFHFSMFYEQGAGILGVPPPLLSYFGRSQAPLRRVCCESGDYILMSLSEDEIFPGNITSDMGLEIK